MTRAAFGRDVRPLLASIQVPTLVIHRQGDRYIRADSGRYLARHIPDAKLMLLPGDDHFLFVGDTDGLVDQIEDFLTGRHQAPEGEVVLAAVLFTDIVGSTERAARLGPRTWRNLLDEHDGIVRAALQQHQGRKIKTIGDGFLASFDGGTRAVRCAMEITQAIESLPLDVRVGIHCGEVEVRGDDVAGTAVTIAKRVCDPCPPGTSPPFGDHAGTDRRIGPLRLARRNPRPQRSTQRMATMAPTRAPDVAIAIAQFTRLGR